MTPEIMELPNQQQDIQAQSTSIKQLQTELKRSSRLRRVGLPPPPLPPLASPKPNNPEQSASKNAKRKSTSVIENVLLKTDSGSVMAKRRRTESDSKSNVIAMEDLRVNVSETIETELEMSQDERNGDEKPDDEQDERIRELRRIEKFLLEVSRFKVVAFNWKKVFLLFIFVDVARRRSNWSCWRKSR